MKPSDLEQDVHQRALLEVRDLVVDQPARQVRVIDGISLTVRRGRTLGLVGESGSGKSVTALAINGLLPSALRATGGAVVLDGVDLLTASARVRREARGKRIGMIFQDPLAALNPRLTISRQIGEILRVRDGLGARTAHETAIDLMRRVEIPEPERRARDYPHQLSGGQRQRVMIALALAGKPTLLLADEPTTALDVSVQARVLEVLARLQREEQLGILLVSHDLRVMAHVAHDLAVMYSGRIAETGPARDLLSRPMHPYTAALVRNIPSVRVRTRLSTPLVGTPPSPARRPTGCAFHPRCPMARERCRVEVPLLRPTGLGRASACHFAEDVRR